MSEPLEETYFNWLYTKVASIDVASTPSLTYYQLFRKLHSEEFVWLVAGDDNRAEEGVDLRHDFFRESGLGSDLSWSDYPCSVLEMLIAFSKRASDQTTYSRREWFWHILENLELADLSDDKIGISQLTEEIVEALVWRTYDADGQGGMFPLTQPPENQRSVEVWYQFSEYVIDKDIF